MQTIMMLTTKFYNTYILRQVPGPKKKKPPGGDDSQTVWNKNRELMFIIKTKRTGSAIPLGRQVWTTYVI